MSQDGEPAQKVLHDGFWKHGRFYGSWRRDKYFFPIDSDELNRMDIFHKFFLVANDDIPTSYPLGRDPIKVMDLGTGTGIWAIHIAESASPETQVMAVDLNRIQPALIPRNLTTKQYDIENRSWEHFFRDCDLIHMRLMLGSIQTDLWPQIYANVFEHLAPGKGMFEHIEIDWTPHWDSGSEEPPQSAFAEWSELFLRAMDGYGRNARALTHQTKRLLQDAGFSDFKEETVRCYVNPWSQEHRYREMGRWFNLGFCHGVEAMSLMPLIDKLGMTLPQVKELCTRVKREVCVLKYHLYVEMHIWTATRPATKSK